MPIAGSFCLSLVLGTGDGAADMLVVVKGQHRICIVIYYTYEPREVPFSATLLCFQMPTWGLSRDMAFKRCRIFFGIHSTTITCKE